MKLVTLLLTAITLLACEEYSNEVEAGLISTKDADAYDSKENTESDASPDEDTAEDEPSCPTLAPGDLFAAPNPGLNLIFIVNMKGERMYFPNTSVYHTWFEDFSGIIEIPVSCADDYPAPAAPPHGINYRPGSRLITSPTSSTLYVVLPKNEIIEISQEMAEKLYGFNWKSRVVSIAHMSWTNYFAVEGTITEPTPRDGMIIGTSNVGDIWYVKQGMRWKVVGKIGFRKEDLQLVSEEVFNSLPMSEETITFTEILEDPAQEN